MSFFPEYEEYRKKTHVFIPFIPSVVHNDLLLCVCYLRLLFFLMRFNDNSSFSIKIDKQTAKLFSTTRYVPEQFTPS